MIMRNAWIYLFVNDELVVTLQISSQLELLSAHVRYVRMKTTATSTDNSQIY
jgi:hypothetical protein